MNGTVCCACCKTKENPLIEDCLLCRSVRFPGEKHQVRTLLLNLWQLKHLLLRDDVERDRKVPSARERPT